MILDNFNRANGNLGTNWLGDTRYYQVASNQLNVRSNGDIYWKTLFGVNQEVFVTLSNIIPGSAEIDLVLKSQSNTNYNKGMIEILYEPTLKVVQVWTYASPGGWIQYGVDIPVTFSNGDQFGARAAVDGTVSIYRNGSLLGTRSVVSWPFFNKGGYLGLWMVSAANMTMDNFGGGNY